MLQVDSKEVIFSKTLLVKRGELAVLNSPELLGLGIQLQATEEETASGKYQSRSVNATTTKISFPFVEGNNLSFEIDELAGSNDGKFSLRFGGVSVGDSMLVQVDVYLKRALNFAPR